MQVQFNLIVAIVLKWVELIVKYSIVYSHFSLPEKADYTYDILTSASTISTYFIKSVLEGNFRKRTISGTNNGTKIKLSTNKISLPWSLSTFIYVFV
jgi:hypothetical protein